MNEQTPTEKRQSTDARRNALLDVRIRLADERILVNERCMIASKGRDKVLLTGIAQGLDTGLAYIDAALREAA